MTRRPTDAGSDNEYTIVGDMKVYVWRNGLPQVLGRRRPDGTETTEIPPLLVAVQAAASKGGQLITMTPHQARALASVLPAAAALADRMEED